MNILTTPRDDDRNPPDDVPTDVLFSRPPLRVIAPTETIRDQKTAGDAFRLACAASGLDDKEIYMPLEIDQGYFSNIRYGKATLKADKVARFCEIVGNTIYLEWMALQSGGVFLTAERAAELQEAEKRATELALRLESVRLLFGARA